MTRAFILLMGMLSIAESGHLDRYLTCQLNIIWSGIALYRACHFPDDYNASRQGDHYWLHTVFPGCDS